jgi:hypothetical protein
MPIGAGSMSSWGIFFSSAAKSVSCRGGASHPSQAHLRHPCKTKAARLGGALVDFLVRCTHGNGAGPHRKVSNSCLTDGKAPAEAEASYNHYKSIRRATR